MRLRGGRGPGKGTVGHAGLPWGLAQEPLFVMRFGVIGTGVIGHLRAQTVMDHPDTRLVAVSDIDQSSLQRTAGQMRVAP